MSHCHSCGRFLGPQPSCPHCGARQQGRLSIRAVKAGALIAATIGLLALWALATRAKVPQMSIAHIQATNNLAFVRLEGRCLDTPTVGSDRDYLSFRIADQTGTIRVSAYRNEAQALLADDRVPQPGDRVEVAGTLRVRDNRPSLTLNAPEHLNLSQEAAVDRSLGTITSADEFLRVRVRGQVRSIYSPYDGLTLITLRDPSGSLPLAIDDDWIALHGTPDWPQLGRTVEVTGTVSLYEDEVQIVPLSPADVRSSATDVSLAEPSPIGEIGPADVGRWVTLTGTLSNRTPFSSGVKFTLSETTGAITLLLWQDLVDALAETSLEEGAQIQATGQLSSYRGEIELIPALPVDIELLHAPPTPTPSPTPRPTATGTQAPTATPSPSPTPTPVATEQATAQPIGSLDAAYLGLQVTVEGSVVDTTSFSKGFTLSLADDSGQIEMVLWHDVYDELPSARRINVGAQLRVTGTVGEYGGQLQLTPSGTDGIHLLQGAAPWAPACNIGSLSQDDVGQRVMIEGSVANVEGIQSAAKVTVSDASGEIVVLIWRNVLDRIAQNFGLGTPGSRVRVVGVVESYQGTLELIPTLPDDVMVLSIGE